MTNYNRKILIKRILIVLLLTVCVIVTVILGSAYCLISSSPENLNNLAVTLSNDSLDEYATLTANENIEYVTIDTLPTYVGEAFIAIEDETFYNHNGVNFKDIISVTFAGLSGDNVLNNSTITEQIVKCLRGSQRSAVKVKFEEQYLATQYEKNMTEIYGSKKASKDKILEVYLNIVNMGDGCTGVQKASEHYLKKDASELTISESAVLASILSYPNKYNPLENPENNRVIQLKVLQNMLDQGYITNDEYIEAVNDDVYTRIVSKK